jgi:hypothetical protein
MMRVSSYSVFNVGHVIRIVETAMKNAEAAREQALKRTAEEIRRSWVHRYLCWFDKVPTRANNIEMFYIDRDFDRIIDALNLVLVAAKMQNHGAMYLTLETANLINEWQNKDDQY